MLKLLGITISLWSVRVAVNYYTVRQIIDLMKGLSLNGMTTLNKEIGTTRYALIQLTIVSRAEYTVY